MGDYRESLALRPQAPDVTGTRAYGRVKRGWGLNAEQALGPDLGAFLRWSWNDGRTETWAFTEVDRSLSVGLASKGRRWGRAEDTLAVACVQNGLSPDHRDYLAAGGLGFILGDARLNYVSERIVEAYYSWAFHPSLAFAFDVQRVWNPGCNADRGPVTLFAGRLHIQF